MASAYLVLLVHLVLCLGERPEDGDDGAEYRHLLSRGVVKPGPATGSESATENSSSSSFTSSNGSSSANSTSSGETGSLSLFSSNGSSSASSTSSGETGLSSSSSSSNGSLSSSGTSSGETGAPAPASGQGKDHDGAASPTSGQDGDGDGATSATSSQDSDADGDSNTHVISEAAADPFGTSVEEELPTDGSKHDESGHEFQRFGDFYNKKLKNIGDPIIHHAKQLASQSVDVYTAASKAVRKIGDTVENENNVEHQAKMAHESSRKEYRDVALHGRDAYDAWDSWKQKLWKKGVNPVDSYYSHHPLGELSDKDLLAAARTPEIEIMHDFWSYNPFPVRKPQLSYTQPLFTNEKEDWRLPDVSQTSKAAVEGEDDADVAVARGKSDVESIDMRLMEKLNEHNERHRKDEGAKIRTDPESVQPASDDRNLVGSAAEKEPL